MSRYGKDGVFQFAIATGLDYTKEAKAPLLKAPPGEGWELIFVQFVTDWYTVWRRHRDGGDAVLERDALEKQGYEPPVETPNTVTPPFSDAVLYKGSSMDPACAGCGAPVSVISLISCGGGVWRCTECGHEGPPDRR